MNKHDHLWNDLPAAERQRLAPYQIECHILHLRQVRAVLVRNHKRALAEIDGWIGNCERSLRAEGPPDLGRDR